MTSTAEPSRSKIAILLCTHNGEAFLKEQLDSFAAQTWDNWCLVVSDDNSTDQTRHILGEYQRQWPAGRLTVRSGPAKGVAENFMAVTRSVQGQADYYAWSDQDDVWHPDKLERAVQWLQGIPVDTPALYCGRTQLVNSDNQSIGRSPLFSKKPSFANALMQNIGGGNTMVFNQAACKVLAETSISTVWAYHDWWAYIIITGCGGQVHYDPEPSLRYRQHGNNTVGSNVGRSARFARLRELLKGRFQSWNTLNVQALQKHQRRLTHEHAETFRLFAEARQRPLPMRLLQFKRSGVYRQRCLDNLGLVLAAILGKI